MSLGFYYTFQIKLEGQRFLCCVFFEFLKTWFYLNRFMWLFSAWNGCRNRISWEKYSRMTTLFTYNITNPSLRTFSHKQYLSITESSNPKKTNSITNLTVKFVKLPYWAKQTQKKVYRHQWRNFCHKSHFQVYSFHSQRLLKKSKMAISKKIMNTC